jgi:hypothetical protein
VQFGLNMAFQCRPEIFAADRFIDHTANKVLGNFHRKEFSTENKMTCGREDGRNMTSGIL